MKIFISFQGTQRGYNFEKGTSISTIKQVIARLLGRGTNEFWFSWKGQILENAQTLDHYNIQEDDILYVEVNLTHTSNPDYNHRCRMSDMLSKLASL
jgi:hypothetical protein